MLKNEEFARLYEGIKHYDLDINPQEVLYQWIIGFRPRPVCMYTAAPCYQVLHHATKCAPTKVAFAKSILASLHETTNTFATRLWLLLESTAKSTCAQLISVRIAESPKLKRFCDDHACFVCLVRSEVADIALEEPPRNSCERHPLCWGLDGMCPEVAEPTILSAKSTPRIYTASG